MSPTKDQLISTYSAKETEELIELYSAGVLSDDAYEVCEQVLKGRQVPLPKRPEFSLEETYKPRSHLKELKEGKKSPKATFWLVCVLGNIALLVSALMYIFTLQPKVILGPLVAYIAYDIFMLLSVWRSFKRAKHRMIKNVLFLAVVFPLTIYSQFITIAMSAALASGAR